MCGILPAGGKIAHQTGPPAQNRAIQVQKPWTRVANRQRGPWGPAERPVGGGSVGFANAIRVRWLAAQDRIVWALHVTTLCNRLHNVGKRADCAIRHVVRATHCGGAFFASVQWSVRNGEAGKPALFARLGSAI